MVRSCQLCKKRANSDVNRILTFHSITNNLNERRVWFALLGFDEDRVLPKRAVLCSDYFKENYFIYKADGKKYLKSGAYPLLVDAQVFFTRKAKSNADASISRHVISSDQYHVITTLIQYYQMETRWSIRQLLLQAFGVLCSLDKTVINIMLNSILPGELARDMMTNPRNIPKLNYSSLLLTMVFSMGEPMPVTHYDFLGKRFLSFLFDNIEYPPDTDLDEQIPDLFLNLVISFNLQFSEESENPVLAALEDKDVAKTFTEKILLLINREEDPVRIFDHEPAPPHSLLKLFSDLFSRRSTADMFYTNDVKVLIDIIVRNIFDLSPGDSRRRQYLELCRKVMRNTNYNEHRHKLDDILKCFTRIFCEENDMSTGDQKVVKEISNEFPHLFK